MSAITTHVLDTAQGAPAAGVPVLLSRLEDGAWVDVATGTTDRDGRIADLTAEHVTHGRYRLAFDTAAYFTSSLQPTFFPEVHVVFEVSDGSHHHVPLLLSPFGYSTYRGS
ncbi:hydroxyisourate hydrolase [Desertivibrio insolitus]|uniref:hydroxyisourate hydrolase n=1 Tax=Herbiconiux sp. SYSU D00978 TaxID=2812562 RepID=UPI001A956E10|nr:hydroxyisourate hydrolase [Herbiconiux sp. SYSU D00978]